MATHAPARTRVRFAVAAVLACAFPGAVHAASADPDSVSLTESTITWSTVKYATDAENGFVDGSLDKSTIVDRTFKTHVLENRYLKVTLVPEFGGRILSIIYKPTGHEQLYRTDVGVPPDGRHRQHVQLRSCDGQADRDGIVQSGVAVDDERQRVIDSPDRCGPRCRGDREGGRDGMRRRGRVLPAGAHKVSPGRMAGPPRRDRAPGRPRPRPR